MYLRRRGAQRGQRRYHCPPVPVPHFFCLSIWVKERGGMNLQGQFHREGLSSSLSSLNGTGFPVGWALQCQLCWHDQDEGLRTWTSSFSLPWWLSLALLALCRCQLLPHWHHVASLPSVCWQFRLRWKAHVCELAKGLEATRGGHTWLCRWLALCEIEMVVGRKWVTWQSH